MDIHQSILDLYADRKNEGYMNAFLDYVLTLHNPREEHILLRWALWFNLSPINSEKYPQWSELVKGGRLNVLSSDDYFATITEGACSLRDQLNGIGEKK